MPSRARRRLLVVVLSTLAAIVGTVLAAPSATAGPDGKPGAPGPSDTGESPVSAYYVYLNGGRSLELPPEYPSAMISGYQVRPR